ncbi:MAG: hypothetical protein ACRDYU_19850 [Actinomycetes bacterium]
MLKLNFVVTAGLVFFVWLVVAGDGVLAGEVLGAVADGLVTAALLLREFLEALTGSRRPRRGVGSG